MNLRIPLAKPEITAADCDAVLEVLRSPNLSSGPKVEEFEDAICAFTKSPFSVAVNSGTSALHLAVKILNLPKGAEVILPSFTFISPLNVLLQENLTPVFVDIEPRNFNVSSEAIEAAITSRTKAIVAVHTFGRPVRIDQIQVIARKHGIALIEDACEAIGAEVGGQKAGTFSDFGALAFYPNKQITTGEGGMLLTANPEFAARARRLRNQGRDSSLDWLQNVEPGYSYRLSDMNCALGSSQMKRIEDIIARRQALAEIYDSNLSKIEEVITPSLNVDYGRNSWFCYVIQLTGTVDRSGRDRIAESLRRKGIGSGRYFAPLHHQPVMSEFRYTPDLPATERVASRALALPFFNQVTEEEVEEICEALAESLLESRRSM